MELSHDDVLEILQLIEHSKLDYLELQVGDTRIVADRTGRGPRAEGAAMTGAAPQVAAAAPVGSSSVAPAPAPGTVEPSGGPAVAAATEAAASTVADLVVVKAPVVGVFYRAPEPGAEPYIEVGATIEPGATVGLVEVMKMFNGVTADIGGEVVEILAQNEEFVEFGQPLVTIRPEPSS